jgi:hypothetical protein
MSGVVNHKVWVALLVAVMAAAMMGALLVDGSDKPAHAGAFPSINEKIAYQSAVLAGFNNDIYTINPDGTYQTNLSISVRGEETTSPPRTGPAERK